MYFRQEATKNLY